MKGPESDPVRQQRDTSAPSCRRRSSRAAGRETPLELIREANQTGTRPPGSGVERTRQRWDILRDVVDQGTTARGSARYMPVMARIPSTAVTRREGQGVHLMRRRSSTMPLETVVNIQGLLNRRKKMSARRPRQTHQTALRSKTSPETENEDDQAAGGGTARWRVKQSRPAILKSRQSMSDMSVQSVDSGHHGNRHSKVSWGGLDIERVTMRFTRDGEAKDLFRRSARKILICLHWMMILSGKDTAITHEMKSFMDMAREIEDMTGMKHIEEATGLSFDPKYYRAKKNAKLTVEVQRIMTLPPEARSPESLQKVEKFKKLKTAVDVLNPFSAETVFIRQNLTPVEVLLGLQQITSYAEYPLKMQEKLAKVAWYTEMGPKRILLKQGHRAENFYFILSGQAQVKKIITDERTGRTQMRLMVVLQDGQSFGELALIHRTERSSTVESVTHMKLLVISREDFLDIFFDARAEIEPDHIKFLRQVEFLKHWPIEKLTENPMKCMFHYFRRGMVVVGDSLTSDWIYIVKSGTCEVLKTLKSTTPQQTWELKSELKRSKTMPDLIEREAAPKTNSWMTRKKSSAGITVEVLEMEDDVAPLPGEEDASAQVVKMPPIIKVRNGADEVTSKSEHASASGGRPPRCSDSAPSPRPATSREERVPGSRRRSSLQFLGRSHSFSLPSGEKPGMSKCRVKLTEHAEHAQKPMPIVGNGWGIRHDTRHSSHKSPCCVQLKKVRPKDVFGLEDVRFPDEHYDDETPKCSVTLVSHGAELIMLSRDFFIEHSNERVKQFLREKVRPYPCHDTLQDNLQLHMNWSLFRKELVGQLVSKMEDTKQLCPVFVGAGS